MTDKCVRWTEALDDDAPAIRRLPAGEGRANLARFTHSGAAHDLVPAAEAGHRAEGR